MEINEQKVDEISLALLYLTTFKDKVGLRAWKPRVPSPTAARYPACSGSFDAG